MGPKINRLSVGDRVKRVNARYHDQIGIIEALETELGPEYASVRFNNKEGFAEQVLKENLIKVG